MKFILFLTVVPAILAAAVPGPEAGAKKLETRACPSYPVIQSCWGECKKKGTPTDRCYNCCYNTCRPC
ncbi:hypothetical protein ABW19_dt0201840 [Dactylella cylindrospora]|nr:hypothetical protein ABW19_dt0201840 [Dactylella cylindrospora]